MFNVTGFCSPEGAPEGCRVKVDQLELVIAIGGASAFTVRKRRLIRHPKPLEFADVLEVRVGRGERSALRGATRAVELVIRDGAGGTEVWRPITREAPDAVAWAVARLREILGHVAVEAPPPAVDEAELAPLVVGGRRGGRARDKGGALGRERDGVAVVQFAKRDLRLRLRADADELRGEVVAWGFRRAFRWGAGEIFAVGTDAHREWEYGEQGAEYGIQLTLINGRRVSQGAWAGRDEATAAADMLARALRVPSQAEWARRFLEAAGGGATSSRSAARAEGVPVLSYAHAPAGQIRVMLGGGLLTVRTLPLPPVRAWAWTMIVNWPVLAGVLVVGGPLALVLAFGFASRPSAVDGLWVLVAIAIWSGLCAIAGVGHHTLVTVDGEGLSLHLEGMYGSRDHYWRLDEIKGFASRWNRIVLLERGGLGRTLLYGDDARELRELAGLLNFAVGAEPPPVVERGRGDV